MGVIEKLEQYIRKVYNRNKVPPRVKAKAVLLYHWGVALRKVEKFIKALGLRGSREAIRQWYHRLSRLVEYVLESSQELYVDETKIKGRRRLYYLWLAVDSRSRPCFVYLSRRRDTWTTKVVLSSSSGSVVTTDRGWWYRRACRELGLEWRHETFGRRNAVERAFFPIKHRLKGFYRRFPWNAKYETISSFLRAFIFLYYTPEGLS